MARLASGGSLADRAFEALGDLIRSGTSAPGTRLPSEAELGRRFGVSRTVVREAISRLKSEGLVESRQGSGVFVRAKNLDSPFRIDPSTIESMHSVLQIIELRQALEGEIAAHAAERRSRGQLAKIRRCFERIAEDVRQGGDGVNADIEFHHAIAESTGNPHFLGLIEFISKYTRDATRTLRLYEATRSELRQQVIDEHQAIYDAISARDSEAARLAARRHMDRASRRLRTAGARTPAGER